MGNALTPTEQQLSEFTAAMRQIDVATKLMLSADAAKHRKEQTGMPPQIMRVSIDRLKDIINNDASLPLGSYPTPNSKGWCHFMDCWFGEQCGDQYLGRHTSSKCFEFSCTLVEFDDQFVRQLFGLAAPPQADVGSAEHMVRFHHLLRACVHVQCLPLLCGTGSMSHVHNA
jgi:hypothetical protein